MKEYPPLGQEQRTGDNSTPLPAATKIRNDLREIPTNLSKIAWRRYYLGFFIYIRPFLSLGISGRAFKPSWLLQIDWWECVYNGQELGANVCSEWL